jgi:hypothetical protein
MTCSGDYDAHNLPHRMFFRTRREMPADFDPRADLSALKEYLSACFEMLYRYDMLLSECGVDPKWEREIVFALNRIWGFNLDEIKTEEAEVV